MVEKKEIAGKKRLLIGKVVSDRMGKTVTARVERTYKDALVKKIVRTNKNYKVHDEQGQAHKGDVIEFYQGRPRSKTKYMYLHRVVRVNSLNQ